MISATSWVRHMLWASLESELACWRAAGIQPCFWWRDDDAVAAAGLLARLLSLAAEHRIPIALGVIPAAAAPSLVKQFVAAAAEVSVLQHGVDHIDRADGGPRSEFSPMMPSGLLAAHLRDGRMRLEDLLGVAISVFVPPWNTVTANLVAAIGAAGYQGLSAYGSGARLVHGVCRIDCHLDILSWQQGPRFKGDIALLRQLVREMRRRRKSGRLLDSIGLLTHHRDMVEEEGWIFLDELFDRLSADAVWIQPWPTIASRHELTSRPAR